MGRLCTYKKTQSVCTSKRHLSHIFSEWLAIELQYVLQGFSKLNLCSVSPELVGRNSPSRVAHPSRRPEDVRNHGKLDGRCAVQRPDTGWRAWRLLKPRKSATIIQSRGRLLGQVWNPSSFTAEITMRLCRGTIGYLPTDKLVVAV